MEQGNVDKRKKSKGQFIDIEKVINQRLQLQTNQRQLEDKFKVEPSINYLKSEDFLSRFFNGWNTETQNEFLKVIGGNVPKYQRAARSFLNKVNNKELEKEKG